MIDGITNSDAIPALERMMQFTGRRHALIVGNIANLSTPNFRPRDVSVEGFQQQLREAIDDRQMKYGNSGGPLSLTGSREIEVHDTAMTLHPRSAGENILFHDRNDRDLERLMQDLVENFSMFRASAQMLRSRFNILDIAIRERF